MMIAFLITGFTPTMKRTRMEIPSNASRATITGWS
jgi:hypothetical protein